MLFLKRPEKLLIWYNLNLLMFVLKLTILILYLSILFLSNGKIFSQVSQPIPNMVIILKDASDPATPNAFSPSSLNIATGETVTWSNNDNVTHTITSIFQIFDSGIINPGNEFVWTFDKEGYYKYYCQLHPFMNGVIVVS